MKKIISLFLTVTMIASLIIAIPVTNVAAAETITDEALFMTYPTYLSNSEMDEGLANAQAAYYAVINSYSDSDQTIAKLMSSMSEGISISIKEGLANLGIGETLYETQAREAATKYMQSMLTNENVIKKSVDIVDRAYKTLKTSYSVASSIDKTTMMADLVKVATENDISIHPDDIDDLVNDLYDADSLETDLDIINEANNLWKIVFEFTEIHAIEKTTLDLLMDELSKSGQTGSDLYLGLSLLKVDMEKDSASYVLKYYATDKAVSYLADKADDLIGAATSANAVFLVTTCMNVFADYIYVNAKAEDLTQAIMQTSFVSSIDICLSQYRLKFLQGTGTAEDIETYKSLYGAYLAAHKATLNTCYDIAKITDKYSLGGDCLLWENNLSDTYTYENYITWCKREVTHDLENELIDSETGNSNITDLLDEETIAQNLARVYKLYAPNQGILWNGYFHNTAGSLGFAAKIFNHIFDTTFRPKVDSNYEYILKNSQNVRLVGMLEEDEVTEPALKELFSKARIGDVIITSGQYDYLQAMIFVSMGENGPIVYDCDSKYGLADDHTYLIQEYELSYPFMADAFSQNGKYFSKPGISLYRATKKISTANSGSSLSDEEYDDSVNFVVENGVLIGYQGTRAKIVIPDGVTEIADNCFNGNSSIRSVYMPNSVKTVGEYAFYNCTSLNEIRFSPNLTIIKSNAFYGCTALRSISIVGSPEIDSEAFRCCSLLKNIVLADSVLKIGEMVFYDTAWYNNSQRDNGDIYLDHILIETKYSEEKALVIKEGTRAIAKGAIEAYDFNESLYIPESLEYWNVLGADLGNITTVYYNAKDCEFQNAPFLASNVKNLYIGENVSKVGQYNFSSFNNVENLYYNAKNCTRFKEKDNYDLYNVSKIIIGDNVQSIPDYAFASTSISTINIPESVTKIGNGAFYETALFSATIPDTVTEIGHSVFGHCFSLSNITLSDSITEIGPNSFENTNLNSFTVPASVKAIDASSFYNTPLSKFIVDERNENYSAIDGILYNKSGDTLEILPGSLFSLKIPKKCKNIKPYAFNNVRFLTTINVESGNTAFKISAGALYSADMKVLVRWIYNMSNPIITIPEGTKIIYGNAFNNINYMTDIYIPTSIETIGYNAFYRDSKLKNVHYNDAEVAWKAIDIDSNGNEALLGAEFHYLQITGTKITTLRVDDKGKVTLAVANAPADAVAYVASYDTLGKLLELQNPTLNNGVAGTSFSTSGVYKYKAFVWKGDTVKPLSDAKEYIFQ